MKVITQERKTKYGIKMTVDAQEIWRPLSQDSKEKLFKVLAGIFRDAYKKGLLVTKDYVTLCEIAIKETPTISIRRYCNMQMTEDRTIMELSRDSERYETEIRKCYEHFYLQN